MFKFLKQRMAGSDMCFQKGHAVSSWRAAPRQETREQKGHTEIPVQDLPEDSEAEQSCTEGSFERLSRCGQCEGEVLWLTWFLAWGTKC